MQNLNLVGIFWRILTSLPVGGRDTHIAGLQRVQLCTVANAQLQLVIEARDELRVKVNVGPHASVVKLKVLDVFSLWKRIPQKQSLAPAWVCHHYIRLKTLLLQAQYGSGDLLTPANLRLKATQIMVRAFGYFSQRLVGKQLDVRMHRGTPPEAGGVPHTHHAVLGLAGQGTHHMKKLPRKILVNKQIIHGRPRAPSKAEQPRSLR